MAEQCIVCLENLDSAVPPAQLQGDGDDSIGGAGISDAPVSATDLPVLEAGASLSLSSNTKEDTTKPADLTSNDDHPLENDRNIAVIQICGHVLHDSCLKAWSGKANSCPICRQAFHLVEVYDKVGGTLLNTYQVEDKKQVAEFDPLAWLDENPEEEEEPARPCPVCNTAENEDVLLLCDGCDIPYHTHCIGLEDIPDGSWFCMECADQLGQTIEESLPTFARAPARRTRRNGNGFFPRTRGSMRTERNRGRTDNWLGAWGQVSGHILGASGIDVDSNDADDDLAEYRRSQQLREMERREWQRWQQRLSIASRLGARDVFARNIQGVVDQQVASQPQQTTPPQETREERHAWHALERARAATPGSRKRKSRSTTASPQEPAPEPERRLKRPRTRRNPIQIEAGSSRPASASANNHQSEGNGGPASVHSPPPANEEQPSFLSSLLKEVETGPASDDETIRTLFGVPQPVDPSSPVTSPAPSVVNSPRALSLTPPPPSLPHNGTIRSASRSPVLSLSSHIEPMYPPANYSPTRSNGESSDSENRSHGHRNGSPELRQPRPKRQRETRLPRSQDASPTRKLLPLEIKESISQVVRAALKPHWEIEKSKRKLSSDQYATINRTVSHKIYEEVTDPSTVRDEAKQHWEKIATKEVARAIAELKT